MSFFRLTPAALDLSAPASLAITLGRTALLSMILNVILWIWGIEVAAGLLMHCVALCKSFGQHGHWARHASKPSL
jgi:hypothetical protein